MVPVPVLSPCCTQSCRILGCTSLGAQNDLHAFPLQKTASCASFGISLSCQEICQVLILQLFWGISTGSVETRWFSLEAFSCLCFPWFDSLYLLGGPLPCKSQQKSAGYKHIRAREKFFHIFTTKKKLEKFAESQLLAH